MNKMTLNPGEARSAGDSAAEIFEADGDNPPAFVADESYEFLGDEVLPAERWTSRAFHDLEIEHMWKKVWQMACREEQIPEVGDHIVYEIGDYSFIVMRSGEDEIKAFKNACLHRGTQLRPTGSEGHLEQIRCPFHGWTWNVSGSLKEIPCRWDFPHVKDEAYSLPEVKVGTWDGFVFINMDPDCESLEDYLGILPDHFQRWPNKDRFMTANVRKPLNCNWKVALEAFLEAYHVVETHPQAIPFTGDSNTKYDLWGDKISRLLTPSGVPSPHMETPPSQDELNEMLMYGAGTEARAEVAPLEPGETPRSRLSAALKQAMKDGFGADLSHLSITEIVDSTEYFLFPNFCPWLTPALPLVYRFLPKGNDPDWCWMDVMLLHPVPDNGPRPDPAPFRELAADEPFTDAPELNLISPVFEQDVSNMPWIQKGLKATERGVTLGNYQEARIRQFHQTLDKYLERGAAGA